MRREPSLTLRGALEILGHREPRVISRLDKILGGVILASGAVAGLAGAGGPALGATGLWVAIWGWTEQKNAALELAHSAIDSVSGKLASSSDYERRQLIAAAHTTIVVAAFFESFREHAGDEFYDWLELTGAVKEALLTGQPRSDGDHLFEMLYAAEVPAPSPSRGFEENVDQVNTWMFHFASILQCFVNGLEVGVADIPQARGGSAESSWGLIVWTATERYRSHFLRLAAEVPEFAIWAMLGENAATRSALRQQSAGLAEALGRNRDALARVEALLALTTQRHASAADLQAVIDRANRGVLNEPILPDGDHRSGRDAEFPAIGRMYINPRFQVVQADEHTRPADGHWWEKRAFREAFDDMLAAYVVAPAATRLPLLMLGDPGAGKSLLTKVFAAQLSGSGYLVVRVPLGCVTAKAPIVDQVQQALDDATNRRVDWRRLTEQAAGAIRVVMLDGLDELLQASSNRSGYLQEVMEFQRKEAEQQRPVVVLVTSRLVVADRVDIPRGTTVVKLGTFTDEDIREWLLRWRGANAIAVTAGRLRALTWHEARQQQDLARQPLLLLMLALYTADPALPALDAGMSAVEFCRRLLGEFARREARRNTRDYVGTELEHHVQDHLDRLAVAALGMFNRGRQHISEDELGADLAALHNGLLGSPRPNEAGQRVIGEFFFVHAAEARTPTSASEADCSSPERRLVASSGQAHRSYEFLHAIFAEYLVASHLMAELLDIAEKAFAAHRGP
jgi:hypothetical protein